MLTSLGSIDLTGRAAVVPLSAKDPKLFTSNRTLLHVLVGLPLATFDQFLRHGLRDLWWSGPYH